MNQDSQVPEITPTELKARLDEGDVPLLVDVREAHEIRIADLPDHGQLRIPTGEFAQRFSEIDSDSDVVVYCRSGARSAWAVAILLQHGYQNVYNMTGGVLGWRLEVDPTLTAY